MKMRHCGQCGTVLDGRQTLYCSRACANAAWNRQHRAERTAYQRARREAIRRQEAGLPPAPTTEQVVIADLLTTIADLKRPAQED